MGILAMLQLILALGGGVLAGLQKAGIAQEIIALVQSGLNAFQQVHDTLVTKGGLEDLRITPQW